MQIFELDAPKAVRTKKPGARDHWVVCDASEIVDVAETRSPDYNKREVRGGQFYDGYTWSKAVQAARHGDNAVVEKSDAFLSEMAQYTPETARRAYIDDVAGATPNIPAFIAGHPLSMRRRIQTRDEYAPLVIAYDPTCSGNISPPQILKRGIVVLALVRALAGLRPVELYVCGGLDWNERGGSWIAVRIETAPLDLARAAHFMTSAGFIRGILYPIIHGAPGRVDGAWPYNSYKVSLGNFPAIARQAFPHAQDVLAIPGVINSDPLLTNPKLWLADTMRRLLGEMDSAA